MTPNTNTDRLSDDAPRRIRWKWFILAGVILLAGFVGFVWWILPRPLTAEERQLVGWWKMTGGLQDNLPSPIITEAVEFRANRTVRIRRRDTRTGKVFYEERDYEHRWRVADGRFILTDYFPVGWDEVARGNYFGDRDQTYRITWEGSNRFLLDLSDLISLAPGEEYTTEVWTRCQPPDGYNDATTNPK